MTSLILQSDKGALGRDTINMHGNFNYFGVLWLLYVVFSLWLEENHQCRL